MMDIIFQAITDGNIRGGLGGSPSNIGWFRGVEDCLFFLVFYALAYPFLLLLLPHILQLLRLGRSGVRPGNKEYGY